MKKLALRLDDLRVDTFAAEAPLAGKGTVQGHYGTNHTNETMCLGSCPPDTCYISCPVAWTCYGMVC
jgi:hypothetical protein